MNNELYHYGVKGMKWKNRKKSKSKAKEVAKEVGKVAARVYFRQIPRSKNTIANKTLSECKKFIKEGKTFEDIIEGAKRRLSKN